MRYKAIFSIMGIICSLAVFAMEGCSGYIPKTAPLNESSGVIYQVSEQQALDLVHWAMRQALPDEKIYKLGQPRVGLFVHEIVRPGDLRWARFKETTYIYEVELRLSQGIGPNGDRVTGYTYALNGNGDLETGPDNLAAIERFLKQAFEQTGRAATVTAVSDFKPGPPKISSPAPPASAAGPASQKPAAPVMAPAPVPEKPAVKGPEPVPSGDVFEKLKKLKELNDQGIITDKEFEAKKKELLDRI